MNKLITKIKYIRLKKAKIKWVIVFIIKKNYYVKNYINKWLLYTGVNIYFKANFKL